jgi:hypothetical protein
MTSCNGVTMEDEYADIKSKLASGCSEEEFSQMRCPKCGAALTLSVRPKANTFFVRCMVNSIHLAMTGEGSERPSWWDRYTGTGWY